MLAWFKFQAQIPSCSWVCVQEEWQKYTLPPPPLSEGEGLKNIGHSMKIKNLIFGVNSVKFHIWFVMTVFYKMWQILLQNATAILLQNATEVYYKMRQVFYYKMRQFYYKMRQLLQNATFITNCDSTYRQEKYYVVYRNMLL